MALREFDRALIQNSPRDGQAPPHKPELVYAFSDAVRRKLLQDPECNKKVFEAALEEPDSLHFYEPHEKWVIAEAKLVEAGLGHWKSEAVTS